MEKLANPQTSLSLKKRAGRKPAINQAIIRDLWFNVGYQTAIGNEEGCISDLRRIIELDPAQGAAFFHIGRIYLQNRDLEKAEYFLACAAELNGDKADVAFFYGTCLAMRGHTAKSVPWLQAAGNGNPADYAAFFNLATSLLLLKKPEEAAQHFVHVLTLKPDHLPSAYNLGIYFMRNNEPQRAKHYFEICLRIDPEFTLARRNMLRISLGENDVLAARFQLKKGIKLAPEDSGLRVDQTALEHFENSDNGLYEKVERALSKHPDLIPETLERIVEFRDLVKNSVPPISGRSVQ